MKILAIGDVVGELGVSAIERNLQLLKRKYSADFVVINGENTDLVGILPAHADRLFMAGANVITLGNHVWNRRQIVSYIENEPALLRPYNLSQRAPGQGYGIFDALGKRVLVMNLIGRCGMQFGPDNPFLAAEKILSENAGKFDFALCDFHAEATSEKVAMGYFLDGKVSAIWGTHTHVQTADEKILPCGTGYITDLGMVGVRNSVLGICPEQSIAGFLGEVPTRFTAPDGKCDICGICITLDDSFKCTEIKRINTFSEDLTNG